MGKVAAAKPKQSLREEELNARVMNKPGRNAILNFYVTLLKIAVDAEGLVPPGPVPTPGGGRE